MDPQDISVELYYGGRWNDITDDVNASQDIVVTRGRRDEATRSDPARCALLLKNRDGKYSPRNPLSPLFDTIGRNTPLRVRVGETQAGLYLPAGNDSARTSARPHENHQITGDIDLRFEIAPTTWRPSQPEMIASKHWDVSTHSWAAHLLAGGELEFSWTTDGTLGTRHVVPSADVVPEDAGRLAIRMSLEVDSDGGHVVRFYTADSLNGSWSPLGDPVVEEGSTRIWDESSDAWVTLGAIGGGGSLYVNTGTISGWIYGFELRDSSGDVVLSPDFGAQSATVDEFEDSSGREWKLFGGAEFLDHSIRFTGEVVAWPPRWSIEEHVWVSIEAHGVLRRLSQGAKPLRSVLRRAIMDDATPVPVVYWPCEDGKNATRLSSATGGEPMTIHPPAGEVERDTEIAAYDAFAASEALPEFHQGSASGLVPTVPETGEFRVVFVFNLPDEGVSDEIDLIVVRTTGTVREWVMRVNPEGRIKWLAYGWNPDEGPLEETLWYRRYDETYFTEGRFLYSFRCSQDGGNIDFKYLNSREGDGSVSTASLSVPGHVGRVTEISLCPRGDAGGTALGHVAVYTEATDMIFWDLAQEVLRGWHGEPATTRLRRIASEEGLPARVQGTGGESLGPQSTDTLLDVLSEAAESDGGILTDGRDIVGLHYRSRDTLYNQEPALILDYAQCHVSAPFEPTDDDQSVVNDVTVSRVDGGSARAVQETGRLSIQSPPDGVGLYDTDVSLSLASDGQAVNQASWRLHLGTVDEPRFPSVTVDLAANPGLADAFLTLVEGDLIRITNVPDWMGPGDVDLLVQGWSETLNTFQWRVVLNCSPASPWTVGVWEDPVLGRADTVESVLTEPIGEDDTEILVSTLRGPEWTEDPGEFPFSITVGGEEILVGPDPLVRDTFTREIPEGWGSADVGGDWVTVGGSPEDFWVPGTGVGVMRLDTAGEARWAVIDVDRPDVDIQAQVSIDTVPEGGPHLPALVARFIDASNAYIGRLVIHTDEVLLGLYKLVDGSEVFLANMVTDLAIDDPIMIRLQVVGTKLRAKAWVSGGAEPAEWMVEAVDDHHEHIGAVGVYSRLSSSSTAAPVSFAWSQFEVGSPHTPIASSARDTFTREVQDGWGIADTGQEWATVGGDPSDYEVTSGAALVHQNSVNTQRWAFLPATLTNVDVQATVAYNKNPTGAGQQYCVAGRMQDEDTGYVAMLQVLPEGDVNLYLGRFIDQAAEYFAGPVNTGLEKGRYRYSIRLQLEGSTLRAKAWESGRGEPGWMITAVDHEISSPGGVGTMSYLETGNTNSFPVTATWSDFMVINPQIFTVERSINGIRKPHAAGTDVRLTHPMIVSL